MKKAVSSGFNAWRQDSQRSGSAQVDFGAWWEMGGSNWRVAWIQNTGELYAAELGLSDRFLLLGKFATKKEVNQTMQRWNEGADLAALLRRFGV